MWREGSHVCPPRLVPGEGSSGRSGSDRSGRREGEDSAGLFSTATSSVLVTLIFPLYYFGERLRFRVGISSAGPGGE